MSPTVTVIVVAVVGLVVVAVIWAVFSALKGAPAKVAAASGPIPVAPDQLRPPVTDFSVRGEDAEIHYGVPLPEGEVDDHLRDLLRHDASLVLHEKRSQGLPIDQITRAAILGRRGSETVEISVIELEEPGLIPEIAAPDLVPGASGDGYDPLARLGEQAFKTRPGGAGRDSSGDLSPFLDEITIAKSVEAQLRAAGIDPTDVSLSDLARSLLKIGGYEVVTGRSGDATLGDGGTAEMFTARKDGAESLIVIVPHADGEHPELPEKTVNLFVVAVAQHSPQRALLITDKFSPYLVYEKERSDLRYRFISRERLQAFVDSFAIQ